MSIHRKNPRRDANEPEIIRALEQVGASVSKISATGFPDLVVGWRGENILMEVKDKKGKLTEDEQRWHDHWRGTVHIVRSADDALALLGILDWRI